MLNEETEEKLKGMKLHGMLGAWGDQRAMPASNDLGFDERFGLIVDAEQLSRDNRKLKRSLTQARLKVGNRFTKDRSRHSERPLLAALSELGR